jgi:hypothetical protein
MYRDEKTIADTCRQVAISLKTLPSKRGLSVLKHHTQGRVEGQIQTFGTLIINEDQMNRKWYLHCRGAKSVTL